MRQKTTRRQKDVARVLREKRQMQGERLKGLKGKYGGNVCARPVQRIKTEPRKKRRNSRQS